MTEANKAKSIERRRFMLEGPLTKVIFVTSIPQVVAMLIDSLYNMADTFFVSSLGDAAMAAVGINDSLMIFMRAISLGFGMGSASYISRALGARKDEDASRAAATTLYTAIAVVFLIFTVICSIFVEPLSVFLGASKGAVQSFSVEYSRWILLSAPITAATVCLSQTLRAEGSTTYSMIGSVSGCVINVILDPIFITVLEMGVAGAAIATGVSKIISLIILLLPFIRRQCIISVSPKFFSPSKAIYGEIAKMGIPVALRTSVMSLTSVLTNNVAKGFGEVALTALTVSNKSMRLVASSIMGFTQGYQPIAGYNWGAGQYKRSYRAFLHTVVIGTALSMLLGALLFIFAEDVLMIFSDTTDVLALGKIFIRTQSVMLAPHMLVMICASLFQATGKALQSGVIGLMRNLIALIPCVLIMSTLFGETGLAWAQAVADAISFTLAAIITMPMVRRLRAAEDAPGMDEYADESVTAADEADDIHKALEAVHGE